MWILFACTVMVIAVAWSYWRHRHATPGEDVCPECSVALAFIGPSPIPGEDPPSYGVWVCPRCPHARISLHPTTATAAACTSCGERSLQVSGLRMPDDDDNRPHVEIRELCERCGHDAVVDIRDPRVKPVKRGLVLPFRRRS
jgi:hypothetical protein